jgi:hypothetical protein
LCDIFPLELCDVILGQPYLWKQHIVYDSIPRSVIITLGRKLYIIQFIHHWPSPTTLNKPEIFLVHYDIYLTFVLGLSHIAWTLNQVTKDGGKGKFVWGKSREKAFDNFIHHFFSSPVLSLPNLQEPFEIDSDSLDYAMGIVHTQNNHLMEYHSETLSYVTRKYPNYEK